MSDKHHQHTQECNHSHSGHHHHHHGDLKGKNLFIAVVLNVIITLSQVIGGVISGSMALLSDALHNFSDVATLLISYFASKIAKKDRNIKQTFGFKRVEILAALFNSFVLVGIGVFLIAESIDKLFNPETIDSSIVIWLAILSIVLNFLSILLLHGDSKESMNIKSAYLHLMTDVLSSIALLVGGLAMFYLGWYWIDPIISMGIAIYLIYASYGLIKESSFVLLQFAPEDIEIAHLVEEINKIEAINGVHHIHLWSLSEKDIHMEAHIDFKENIALKEAQTYLKKIEILAKEFGITHTTLQPEKDMCESKEMICA